MANSIPEENYPFATKDGEVIPLDIIKSKGIIRSSFNALTSSDITLPAASDVAVLFASEACFIISNDGINPTPSLVNPVYGVFYPNVLYVPKNHAITCSLKQGVARVIGETKAGVIVIDIIERWAGLSLDIAYSRR